MLTLPDLFSVGENRVKMVKYLVETVVHILTLSIPT